MGRPHHLLLSFNPPFSLILLNPEGNGGGIRRGIKFWIERFIINLAGELGFKGDLASPLPWCPWLAPCPLPTLWPLFSMYWLTARPFLDLMPPPPTEVHFLCIQGGPQVTELGQLCNWQASVPNENTGPLVQKAGKKTFSCGFSLDLSQCFFIARADPHRSPGPPCDLPAPSPPGQVVGLGSSELLCPTGLCSPNTSSKEIVKNLRTVMAEH